MEFLQLLKYSLVKGFSPRNHAHERIVAYV